MTENVVPALNETDLKIVQQIEYYFGNINFPRDTFLQEQVIINEGWVPITTMLKFNRLAAISEDVEKIAQAVRNSESEIVEVSDDNTNIRRNVNNPPPEHPLEYLELVKHRSVYMKGFPLETKLDQITNWATQFGKLENVQMRKKSPKKSEKEKDAKRTFRGSVFITFQTREEAEAAQKSDIKFGEIEIEKMMQEDHWTSKKKETKEERTAKVSKNKLKKAEKVVKRGKGLILAIDNLPLGASADKIKSYFRQYGSIGYVARDKGSTKAKIRFDFESEGGAQGAWEKAVSAGEDGKVMFMDKELSGRVVGGEEEQKFWREFDHRREAKKRVRNRERGLRDANGVLLKSTHIFFEDSD